VNPEFLAEGTAVRDFLSPDRVVIGAVDRAAADAVVQAYEPILARALPPGLPDEIYRRAATGPQRVPTVICDPSSAELMKYAANAFLAVKISFINEMARFAEKLGADVTAVSKALGLDRRIGPTFLRAGIGWGGSCFPKDIDALQGMARRNGLHAQILAAANEVNAEQRMWVVRQLDRRLGELKGRVVTLLGLAFKPHTDDLRNAPALEIAGELLQGGATVRAYDPVVVETPFGSAIELAPDVGVAAKGADAVVLVTEWPEFAELDLAALRGVTHGSLLVDGRNLFDPVRARDAGFEYVGVGR
jgi:UDPglucose 6-dehydrogenase